MNAREERVNLSEIMSAMPNPEDLAWDHAMDISASIYGRLKELGMSQKGLADAMGVSAGRVSQIISGAPGMSLKTLAKIEAALDMRLDAGFRYGVPSSTSVTISSTEIPHDRPKAAEWKGAKTSFDHDVFIGGLAA